ncbi:TetR/AcrR family transcriptional regulator, partial [Rhizobium ruizarguesonis]
MAGQPRSRRERQRKPALSREGIIAAEVALFHEEGLAKVTMRRVAAVLDTGPASLYVYISDTEDLHAEVLDALL